MIRGSSGPWTARRTLLVLSGGFGVVLMLWLAAWVADLHDGRTWNERSRYEAGPRWVITDRIEDPSGFRMTMMVRYVLPVTMLATISLVCLLGALSQPKVRAE